MLKLIRTGFSSLGKEEIKKEIKELVNSSKNALMIVPEQQTVISELELASALPSSAPLYFEVTNFTRLANTTFRALGGIGTEYCDKTKKKLLMWRTLTELSHTLEITRGQKEITIGTVESALKAVNELQALSISQENLLNAMENEKIKSDKRLYSKLNDLARIQMLYKSLLGDKYSDTGDDCEIMTKKLIENPAFLSGYHIYVDGFTSFTEPQYKLLGILSKRTSLTVLLATSKYSEDFFEHTELKETKQRLISVARKSSADVKLVDRGNSGADNSESIALLIDRIWRKNPYFDNITLQNSDEIRIFEAKTPFEECGFIASDIKRRVMNGCSYRDFAIIAKSEGSYTGILDGALKLCKIPYFSGERKNAEAYEIIKLIYSAYAAVRSGFSAEYVITYAKCGLTGISREECDLFESYVDTWQLTGSRFTDETVWNMNPEGYNAKRKSSADKILVNINNTKKRLISPLMDLSDGTKDASTVREHASVLLAFLLSLNTEAALKERSTKLSQLGEKTLAEENLGLWNLICSSLDTLTEVMGDSECSTDGFVGQLKILFSGVDMGKIPAHYDEVTIGSADIIRLSEKKHIYLIGVNEGVFPAPADDSAYFSDKDRELLSLSGLSIRPQLETKGARELYIFSRAMSYARESLTFLYSSTSTRFKALEPSEVISKITLLTGGRVRPRKISELELSESLFSPVSALENPDSEDNETVKEALKEAGFAEKIRIREESISNESMSLGEIYRERLTESDLSLSQSKIDSYVNCPLLYFCRYTVALSPEKRAEFDASGIGTLVHSIIENFFRMLKEKNMSAGEITSEEREELTKRAAEKYIREIGEDISEGSTRTAIKLSRLCRAALPVVEGLCEEFSVSKFLPRYFELAISEGDPTTPDPVKIKSSDGRSVVIGGIIDRVDTYEKNGSIYVRVVDYKTGKKEFSPEDLAEGNNLQMFLYLRSITETQNEDFKKELGVKEGGKIIPAGALYFKAFIGDKNITNPDDALAVHTVKAEQKRLGMLLDDEEIINAMGMKYTPLYREKSPNTIHDSKRKLLYSEESFEDIMKTVEDSVIKVADSMKEGNISATPRTDSDTSACDYCEYKPICRNVKPSKKRKK